MGNAKAKLKSDDSPIGKLNLSRTFYNYGDISTDCRTVTGTGDGSFLGTCDPDEVMTGYDPNIGLYFDVLNNQGSGPLALKCCKLKNPLDSQTSIPLPTSFTAGLPVKVLNPVTGLDVTNSQWGIPVYAQNFPQQCGPNTFVGANCIDNGSTMQCEGKHDSNLWCGYMNNQQSVDFPAPANPAPPGFTFYKTGEYSLTDCKNIPAAPLRQFNPGVGDHTMTSCPDGYVMTAYSFNLPNPFITCCKPDNHPIYKKYLDEIRDSPQKCCYFGAIGNVSDQFPAGSDERNVCDYLGLSPDIGKSQMSPDCYRAMNAYCADNMDDVACQTYCNQPDVNVNCDDAVKQFCATHPDASNDICGCFRPDAFANYQAQLTKDFPDAAGLIAGFNDVNCYYPGCESAKVRPYSVKQGIHPGCTALVCLNNVTVDNNGSIEGGITVNQSNDCEMWQTKDCEISWGNWSDCDANGNQTRVGTITQQPLNGGAACPPTDQLTQTRKCGSGDDCQVTCGEWSDCSVACGGGTQSRDCTVVTQPSGSGDPCPPLHQTQPCNTGPCGKPVDCQVSWSAWGPCVGGRQTRVATVTVQPSGGGKPCPALTETQMCTSPSPPSGGGGNKTAIIVGSVMGGVVILGLIIGIVMWARSGKEGKDGK